MCNITSLNRLKSIQSRTKKLFDFHWFWKQACISKPNYLSVPDHLKLNPTPPGRYRRKNLCFFTWRITFTHKVLFGSHTKCFMANPILSDYPVWLDTMFFKRGFISIGRIAWHKKCHRRKLKLDILYQDEIFKHLNRAISEEEWANSILPANNAMGEVTCIPVIFGTLLLNALLHHIIRNIKYQLPNFALL